MARNTIDIDRPPDVVWSVLEDPYLYPRWVVGTERTLSADASWPAPGSAFTVHLAFGLRDQTTVREVEPGRRIVLDAAANVFGPARVTIELEARGDGTRVTLHEKPRGKATPLTVLPPVHLGIHLRNVESLRRFRDLAVTRGAGT